MPGRLAQLAERHVYTVNVGGSNPSPPTTSVFLEHRTGFENVSEKDVTVIRDLEERRYAAMRAGDIGVLEELLHDELAYMHSTGALESKSSYLAGLRLGTSGYKKIEYGDQTICVHGDLAMVFHHLVADAVFEGKDRRLDNRLLAIWVREDGEWRMIGLQSGPVSK